MKDIETFNPHSEEPAITRYLDYRKYLSDWYDYKKATQASFTGAIFAKKAKIKSHSLLRMVIRGERNLTYKTINAFSSGLGLKKDKAKYFENLVLYNQAQTSEEKIKYLGLFKATQISANPVIREIKDSHLYFSSWHVVAIRELAALPGFKPDPEWICKKLKSAITKDQAKSALELLERLELIQITPEGCTRPEGAIFLYPRQANLPLQEFYKSFFKRMTEAFEKESFQDREVGAATLAVTTEEIAQIKTKLKETLDFILENFGKTNETKEHVITVQMQALQLTNP